ncbi:GNAT family N-acetyltransferase [Microbacterium sp. KSW4-16]|uniref:GNAT family N-acetyltransferase n=1 Tax=Microbacterium aurugineum TaxID=2851642 RepID=UPI0020BE96FE|nr:GNAT family N-acetyltransferase [Microbacterium aurugineum]MCK8468749.1 GNAT family N-acetyltransferase [Microbacterium aurugineum]
MTQPLSLTTFAQSTSASDWHDIADLFVAAFSASPYFEDPNELRTITDWGPQMLAGDGRLVTARADGELVGFALAHGLSDDAPWQQILSQLEDIEQAAAALETPQNALVVHELAVRESERGQGVARACMQELLDGRSETQTFIGVYERAVAAQSMYRHWHFDPIGRVPMPGDAIALHVLTAPTAQALTRLTRTISPIATDRRGNHLVSVELATPEGLNAAAAQTPCPLALVVLVDSTTGHVLFGMNTWRREYELPGGIVESGETFFEAAQRELDEERESVSTASSSSATPDSRWRIRAATNWAPSTAPKSLISKQSPAMRCSSLYGGDR